MILLPEECRRRSVPNVIKAFKGLKLALMMNWLFLMILKLALIILPLIAVYSPPLTLGRAQDTSLLIEHQEFPLGEPQVAQKRQEVILLFPCPHTIG